MKNFMVLVAAVFLMSCSLAFAGVDRVYGPGVEKGETELEFRGTVVEDDGHPDDELRKERVGLGHGVTDSVFVEGYLIFEDSRGEDYDIEAYELETKFQLSEPGEYVVDYGFLVELEKENSADAGELKMGPLFQKTFGQVVATANVFAETKLGGDRESDSITFDGRAQVKYLVSECINPAIEYYGDDNIQAVGPVLLGEIEIAKLEAKWQAGVLFGADSDSPDTTYRWMLEFEF